MTDSIQKIPNRELVIGKKLGEGGFGIVYKGSWAGEDVAIKTLRMTTLSSETEKEFTGEASAMAKLNNPRIIRLYGICTEPGHYAMVMAFMPRGDLYGLLCEKEQALPWTLRWRLATDVGIGLSYLHGKNILHRDLKSLNILLDGNLRAKITDFGLAKLRQQTKSIYTNKIRGSLPWMAPELFERRPKLTDKADVYAYGMVLWEIASRKIPFSDAHDPSLISAWVEKGEREDIPKDCPKLYAEVIEQCWKGKPEERPTAAVALGLLQQTKSMEVPFRNNNISSEPSKKSAFSTDSNLSLSDQMTKTGFSFGSEEVQKVPDHYTTSQEKGGPIKLTQDLSEFNDWQCLKTLKGHSSYVYSLTSLANGRIASGCQGMTIKIWDVSSGQCLNTLQGHSDVVNALTTLPNGRIASGSWDKTIKIWDVSRKKCLKTLKGHSGYVYSLTSLANGRIASGSSDKTIKIWDVSRKKCLKTLKGHSSNVFALTALPNGHIASGSFDSTIKIWDVSRKQCLKTLKTLKVHSYSVNVLTALPGGRIASGFWNETTGAMIKIWDVSSGQCLKSLKGLGAEVRALTALSGGRLASGYQDKTIKIWDVSSGQCLNTLQGHGFGVTALTALPNGHIASGSVDKTIKIWSKR